VTGPVSSRLPPSGIEETLSAEKREKEKREKGHEKRLGGGRRKRRDQGPWDFSAKAP